MYLLKRFGCHLNVMVCSGIEAIKYVFKYVYKQPSRANINLSESGLGPEDDGVERANNYFHGLAIGADEAC